MHIKLLFKFSSTILLSSVLLGAAGASFAAYADTANTNEYLSLEDSFISSVNWQLEPYIGADAFTRNMRYKDEPTHPFQEHLNTFQPFVGLRLHKYFGVEAGYQQSEKGTKERFFRENETPVFFGGGPLNLRDNAATNYTLDVLTKNMVKGWNVGIVGFYPLCTNKTDVFLKLGYANLSHDAEIRLSAVEEALGLFAVAANDYHHLHDETGMLSLTLGLSQQFTHHFGGRLFVNFDRTSRLKNHSQSLLFKTIDDQTLANRGAAITTNPHNSWGMGMGLFYVWR